MSHAWERTTIIPKTLHAVTLTFIGASARPTLAQTPRGSPNLSTLQGARIDLYIVDLCRWLPTAGRLSSVYPVVPYLRKGGHSSFSRPLFNVEGFPHHAVQYRFHRGVRGLEGLQAARNSGYLPNVGTRSITQVQKSTECPTTDAVGYPSTNNSVKILHM